MRAGTKSTATTTPCRSRAGFTPEKADKNHLDTGTLGFTDIHNEADFKTEHSGVSLSGGDQFKGSMPGGVVSMAGNSGHTEGTTQSAVADGTITIRDKENQQQDVAGLSRDTEHANDSLSPIFDKEKEQKRLQTVQAISEIGGQAADIARTQGEINATKAANEKMQGVTPEERDAVRAQWQKENPGKTPTEKDINDQIYQGYYTRAINDSGFGTGGNVQRGIQAATAALQGLAGGNIAGALAGASALELAHLLKATEKDPAVNAVAHAILGGAVAMMQGNSAAAGAAGAASAELAARAIMATLYPGKTAGQLTEEEKQTVSTLATISAGMAGGIAGDSTSGAAGGAQAGKNAVENNALSSTQALTFDKELSDCRKSGGDCQAVIEKWKQVSDKQSAETDQKLKDNPLEAVVVDKEVAQGGSDMANRPVWLGNIGADVMTSDEAKAYVQQWNGQDLANIDVNSPTWTKFAVFASDPENQAMLVSGGLLAKDLVQLAKATVTNLSQDGIPFAIKSMQVGLRNPQQVDQLKNDMVSGNYKFTAPEGRIAGYVDSKGNYYISEGNHRMVAAQKIYKKTGDASYIEKLIHNSSWTQTKNAPAGASSMPTRK